MRTHALILGLAFITASIDITVAAAAQKPARPAMASRRTNEPMRQPAIPPSRPASAPQSAGIMQSGRRAIPPAPMRPVASRAATAVLVASPSAWAGAADATASVSGLSPVLLAPFVASALVPVLMEAALTAELPPPCRCDPYP